MANSSSEDNELLLCERWEDQLLLHALEESARYYEVPHAAPSPFFKMGVQNNESPSKEIVDREETFSKNGKHDNDGQCEFSGLDENGFDRPAGSTWIYPTNYPIRDYQLNIVENALFKNTLVCLPTGLGKTFIAAVVMYNFYRWYPQGKILFMAPTKPLVSQQIDSCYKVMGIPKQDTAEMTGQMPPHVREQMWKKCRLFFLTPQSLMSDLTRSTCPVQLIRCIVIDEAHRATGNYAYCQVIQAVLPFNKLFRVLALSATPGNDMEAVQQVIKNLLIDHVEVRDELSSDTIQYVNERTVDTIVVKLEGFHKNIYDMYANILGSYMDNLLKYKVIFSNPRYTSKFSLIKAREKFRSNPPSGIPPSVIEGHFALCITLAHGLELLVQHGLRNFYQYVKGVLNNSSGGNPMFRHRLCSNDQVSKLMSAVKERIGEMELKEPDLNSSIGVIQTQSPPSEYSHPKMEKLRDVIINHFQSYQLKNEETRVMVFCQYRDTVAEVYHLLVKLKPLVKVMQFVGQSAGKLNKGLTQKKQLQIMETFRKGVYNTLISTSIGEEGLDIGEVDLIICYDAHASPIRLVQRMGRTGRKRQGRIVMLLTEGKEHKKYLQSLSNRKSMNSGLVNSKKVLKFLYPSPRMVPPDLEPECFMMFMSMPKSNTNQDLKKMLKRKSNCSKRKILVNVCTQDFEDGIPPDILPDTIFLHSLEAGELVKLRSDTQRIDFASHLSCLLNDTTTINVARSSSAKDFQDLLEFAARQRCNVSLTQTARLASQISYNDLWPSGKRKKTFPQPRKKRKKEDNCKVSKISSNDRLPKQRRLTNLWTAVGETLKDELDDTILMPPPLPPQKHTFQDNVFDDVLNCKENDLNIVNDVFEDHFASDDSSGLPEEERKIVELCVDLQIPDKLISKVRELEDDVQLCCEFSKSFLSSDLTSFLIGSNHFLNSNTKKSIDICKLANCFESGYFDDLLNPDVWLKRDCVSLYESESAVNDRKQIQNISSDSESTICGETLSALAKHYDTAESHENIETHLLNNNFLLRFSASNSLSEANGENMENNFNIGISQLLNASPEELDVDRQKLASSNDVCIGSPVLDFRDISKTNDGKIYQLLNKESYEEKELQQDLRNSTKLPSKEHCSKVLENCYEIKTDCGKENFSDHLSQFFPEVNELFSMDDFRNLSQDDDVIKLLGNEQEIRSVSPRKVAHQSPSSEPISPIVSTQRKKTVFPNVNSSTPKPDKKVFLCSRERSFYNTNQPVDKMLADDYIEEIFLRDFPESPDLEVENKQRMTFNTPVNSSKPALPVNESNDIFNSSLDDFEAPLHSKQGPANPKKKKIARKPACAVAEFIDNEAEESKENCQDSSDGENTSGLDELDGSFVDDEEHTVHESVDIEAHYLQTVRSPLKGHGKFKIKELPMIHGNIYSQALTEEEMQEDYEEDSFCVSSCDEETHAADTLDILEAALKKRKKRKRVPNSPLEEAKKEEKKRRKRICVMESSSEEENDVLKNIQFTQVSKDSTDKTKSIKERGKENGNPSFGVSNAVNTSNIISGAENLSDVWGDVSDEIAFLNGDDICLETRYKKDTSSQKEVSVLKEKLLKSPCNVYDKIEHSQINSSKCGKKICQVRKQLQFCKDTAKKETLMTDFFAQAEKGEKDHDIVNRSKSPADTEDVKKKKTSVDSGSVLEITKKFEENYQGAKGNLVILASSRQVPCAPEIITALKSCHQIDVQVHTFKLAHYIVSPRIGVLRFTFKDFCNGAKTTYITDLATSLIDLFQESFIIIEYNLTDSAQKSMWSAHCMDLSVRLKKMGIKVMYSDLKATTADLLANLCWREFSCGQIIRLPASRIESIPVLRFLEELPGVNLAIAFKICCEYKSVKDFLKDCQSALDIREKLGLHREMARKMYYILNDN